MRKRPSVFRIALVVLWIIPVAALLLWGWDYYVLPVPERPFSPLHELLKPSGLIGLGLGIFGTLFMLIGVGTYVLRKRIPWLDRAGKLGPWLGLHIFLGTLGPVFIIFHTGFRLGGFVAIGFWAMIAVALTGFFGRYLYTRIPAGIQDRAERLATLRKEQAEVVESINRDFGPMGRTIEQILEGEPLRRPRGLLHAVLMASRRAMGKRRRLLRLREALSPEGARKLGFEPPDMLREELIAMVRRQVALEQKIVLLRPFQSIFKFAMIFHIPLSIVMAIIVTAHIALAIFLGYTWIF